MYDPATLTITGLGLEIVDTVVISFCILEKGRRARGNGAANMAAPVAIPLSAIVINSKLVQRAHVHHNALPGHDNDD